MDSTSGADNKIKPSDIKLIYYYIVGIVATTIGILVVVLLNFTTPLELIRVNISGQNGGVNLGVVFWFFLPRLGFVLTLSYVIVIIGINTMLKPISTCLNIYKKGNNPAQNQVEAAKKRLLNMHYKFVSMNVLIWILIPVFVGLSMVFAGISDHRTIIILSARASMVGLISSAIASQRIESISRLQLIPFFFPKGQMSQLSGIPMNSISKRIQLVNRLSAVVPITILLVTLLTLQWELEVTAVPAIAYGRGIIIFTFVLLIWTIIFSRELNRLLSKNIIGPVNDLVDVLKNVQKGQFNKKVQVLANDEIGYAGDVVNEMTKGLYERESMQQSLYLARKIQQNLLPGQNPVLPGLDIAGKSVYCDETGGDFYDFLLPEENISDRIRVVIGDVSGHGISSAILMATARAFFRQRSAMPGQLGQIVTDVNRMLCRDVEDSGNFMTLFCVELSSNGQKLEWVRAGHDPAFLYDIENDKLTELKGEGVALGLDDIYQYTEYKLNHSLKKHIALLYTDGIWEAQDKNGDRFGKEKLIEIVKKNSNLSAQRILESIINELNDFLIETKYQDDATLIIVKFE